MIDCSTFLARYSDYRDGELSWAERIEMDEHTDECPSCARYDRVVRGGTELVRSLPVLEVSDDFGERLRWRLYHADHEARRARAHAGPAQAAGTLAIAAAVAVAAWIPLMQRPATIRSLPAVAAVAPRPMLALRRLMAGRLHQEATGLTSRLAQIGVTVNEAPYHDVVFRSSGPLVGQLAAYSPPPAPDPQP